MSKKEYIRSQDINGDICYRCRCKLLPSRWDDNPDPPGYKGPWIEDAKDEQGFTEWHRYNHDALRWQHYGRYGGRFDTVQRTLILCSKCTDEVLEEYIREHLYCYSSFNDYHWERREKRNEEAIQQKWDARKKRRQLRSLVKEKTETPQTNRLL